MDLLMVLLSKYSRKSERCEYIINDKFSTTHAVAFNKAYKIVYDEILEDILRLIDERG